MPVQGTSGSPADERPLSGPITWH